MLLNNKVEKKISEIDVITMKLQILYKSQQNI